jgi:DedD protein
MANSQDTEITLGTGKMLALFFGLVVVCAAFFGVGFSLGRDSMKAAAPDEASSPVPAGVVVRPAGARSSAAMAAKEQPANSLPAAEKGYVQSAAAASPAPTTTPLDQNSTGAAPKPAPHDPMLPVTAAGIYFVQVAAVSKQEDAEALVSALKKKQYPAFASGNVPADKLIRVQLGPFADVKDAESVRARLISDGYNPILKK